MRESERVEILRNLLAAQEFLFIAELTAPSHSLAMLREAGAQTLVADPEMRITVTA